MNLIERHNEMIAAKRVARSRGPFGSAPMLIGLSISCLISFATEARSQTTTLSPGFGTQSFSGTISAEVDAGIFGTSDTGLCAGFVATRPNHVLRLAEPLLMTLQVSSWDGATSLVVHGPSVRICSGLPEQSGAELLLLWPAGSYSVFVAAPNQYDYRGYDLLVIEGERERAESPLEGTPELRLLLQAMDDEFVDVDPLLTGTVPDADLFEWNIVGAEGPILIQAPPLGELRFDGVIRPNFDAIHLGTYAPSDCAGRFPLAADFQMEVAVPASLRIAVTAREGAALLVMGPTPNSSGWHCSSGSDGASVIQRSFAAGTYQIYVGGFSADDFVLTVGNAASGTVPSPD